MSNATWTDDLKVLRQEPVQEPVLWGPLRMVFGKVGGWGRLRSCRSSLLSPVRGTLSKKYT